MPTPFDLELIRRILETSKAPVKAMDVLTALQRIDSSLVYTIDHLSEPDSRLTKLVTELKSLLTTSSQNPNASRDRWRGTDLSRSPSDSVASLDRSPWVEGTWGKHELERVGFMFPHVENAVHEYNPLVQQLANFLGRKTRSVEAQLLMFRNLQKDSEYPWGNMNQRIPEIWDRRHEIWEHGLAGIRPDGTIDADYVPDISEETPDMPSDERLQELILELLRSSSDPLKAKDIASALGEQLGSTITKAEINPILYGPLKDQLIRDGRYRWSLNGAEDGNEILAASSLATIDQSDQLSTTVSNEENGDTQENTGAVPEENTALAPDCFTSWLAHGSGSVRRPFADASGRPLGKFIDTPLTRKLETLATRIALHETTARLIMLAGGPGNGKSDSIEVFFRALARASTDPEDSLQNLESTFGQTNSRTVDLQVGDLLKGLDLPFDVIRVVQDASEGNDSVHKPGRLLLNDLKVVDDPASKVLLVCCVNRGILDEARLESSRDESDEAVNALVRECFTAIRPASPPKSCWPLRKKDDIYIWPMDVESLCENVADDEPCVADTIMEFATTPGLWDSSDSTGDVLCPLEMNRRLLQLPERRIALCRLLMDEEIAAGRRWTFRDLFGLLASVFTGGTIRDGHDEPSTWSRQLQEKIGSGSPRQELIATFNLLRATYPQVIFPRWPSAEHLKTQVASLKLETGNSYYINELVEYLSDTRGEPRSRIDGILANDWSDRHDPASGCPLNWNPNLIKGTESVRYIEDTFSISLHAGLSLCENTLTLLERKSLELLCKIEKEIDDAATDKPAKQAAALECMNFVKHLGSIIVKRSLSVRDGYGLLTESVSDFKNRIMEDDLFLDEAELLAKVLGGNQQMYSLPLHATFGQPRSYATNGPTLSVSLPSITPDTPTERNPNAPPWRFRQIKLESGNNDSHTQFVDYTFELFLRLKAEKDRLRAGCLDRMIDGCLDRARAELDGKAVRLWEGNSRHWIDLEYGTYTRIHDRFRFTNLEDNIDS